MHVRSSIFSSNLVPLQFKLQTLNFLNHLLLGSFRSLTKMSSYGPNPEKIPLLASTRVFEGWQWKRYQRNVGIGLGIMLLTALVVTILVSSNPTANQISPSVPKGEKNLLKLVTPFRYGPNTGIIRKTPILKIKQGRLQGTVLESRKGRDYSLFYSIPYGKPPINELRFEPPQPAESWMDEVYDSTYARTQCVTRVRNRPNSILGSEDCLHLHIATPKLPGKFNNVLMPVMVYIFGGGFNHGATLEYNPKFFMDEDVLVVLVDYRNAVLGLLNTGDGVIGGNMSLKDQSLALRWVRDNIEAFGGDPEKVLLFGQSSGSMSIHAHLLSDMSRGLFRGAISQSGVVLGSYMPDLFLKYPGSIARRLGEKMNCPEISDSNKLAKCLKEVDLVKLATAEGPGIFWGITGEAVPGNGDTSQMFLKDKPMNLMRNGNITKVPWIVGVNSGELFYEAYELLRDQEAVNALNQDWATLVMDKNLHLSPSHFWLAKELQEFYFNGSRKITREDRYALTNLISDGKLIHPSYTAGLMHSKHSPVYFYYFSKESNFSFRDEQKYDFKPPYGVGHADELQYLFAWDRYPEVTLTDDRLPTSEDLVKIWVSFAYNLVPDPLVPEPWDPIEDSQDGLVWYQLNERPMRKNIEPFTERMKFWDRIASESQLYG